MMKNGSVYLFLLEPSISKLIFCLTFTIAMSEFQAYLKSTFSEGSDVKFDEFQHIQPNEHGVVIVYAGEWFPFDHQDYRNVPWINLMGITNFTSVKNKEKIIERADWRQKVIEFLNELGKLCVVICPTPRDPSIMDWKTFYNTQPKNYDQIGWENYYRDRCEIFTIWLPAYFTASKAGPYFTPNSSKPNKEAMEIVQSWFIQLVASPSDALREQRIGEWLTERDRLTELLTSGNVGCRVRAEAAVLLERYRLIQRNELKDTLQLVCGAPIDADQVDGFKTDAKSMGLTWHSLPVDKKSELVPQSFLDDLKQQILKFVDAKNKINQTQELSSENP